SGSCADAAGNSASASYDFKYDLSELTVTATPSRAADSNDWYNHTLSVSFAGSGGTGLTCDAPETYDGPDTASAAGSGTCADGTGDAAKPYAGPDTAAPDAAGRCVDAAGNVGSASAAFSYDATAPAVTATAVREPNAAGWYKAPVAISFAGTDATSGGVICD